jgi:hypothetical protein
MQVFMFLYRKLNNMDGVKQQDSTPQNDSTLGRNLEKEPDMAQIRITL